jgi:hypothetical protein
MFRRDPRDADDMEAIAELVGKLIEHVCIVSKPGEQNQSLARTAPIQDLKLNSRLDRDETNFMCHVSQPQTLLVERSCVVEPGAADLVGAFVELQTFGPGITQTIRMPKMPSAIKSQTFHFPMSKVLVFEEA